MSDDTHTCSQPRHSHPVSIPAQVDREIGLRHQSLVDHVFKDRYDVVRSNGLESQSQDAISSHASHEGSLCLAKSNHLFGHRDTAHLDTHDSCQSQLNRPQRYATFRSKQAGDFVLRVSLPEQCHCPDTQSCCQCRTGWTETFHHVILEGRGLLWVDSVVVVCSKRMFIFLNTFLINCVSCSS